MSGGGLVVIGDALLDRDVSGTVERLAPDAPVPVLDERTTAVRPGGAALAAALATGARNAAGAARPAPGGDGSGGAAASDGGAAASDGGASRRRVSLVTALADDEAGRELARLLAEAGVEVVDLGLSGATPEKIRFACDGRPLLRLDRGGDGRPGPATAAARAAIGWADALLVSDYGRGVAAEPGVRGALAARADAAPIVWDPHPRGPSPVAGVTLATPNAAEAVRFAGAGETAGSLADAAAAAAELRRAWRAEAVCVTRGAAGALVDLGGTAPVAIPVAPARGGDPCGAGDRFAVTAATALADGADPVAAVLAAAEAATAFVEAGGAAAFAVGGGATANAGAPPDPSPPAAITHAAGGAGSAGVLDDAADPFALAAAARAAGGVVVAAGGCFDLLHAGHVRTLTAARALGDVLIVCINSDESVRRLKGPGRPLVEAAGRAAVLAALGCVDAVAVFAEDTPCELLERLRPDVWVKGGDYAGAPLPEERVLARWGGRSVLLPHHPGHSTTRLIEEAIQRAAS